MKQHNCQTVIYYNHTCIRDNFRATNPAHFIVYSVSIQPAVPVAQTLTCVCAVVDDVSCTRSSSLDPLTGAR